MFEPCQTSFQSDEVLNADSGSSVNKLHIFSVDAMRTTADFYLQQSPNNSKAVSEHQTSQSFIQYKNELASYVNSNISTPA